MADNSSASQVSPEINTNVPQTARIWNYWLGGKDNFVDRQVGDQVLEAFPAIVENARASRAFLARAVRYLAGEAGIRQFLDIGTGLPTASNTHQVAQAVAPECRIVYVDNDPIAGARLCLADQQPRGRHRLHRSRPARPRQDPAGSDPDAGLDSADRDHADGDPGPHRRRRRGAVDRRTAPGVPAGSYLTMNDGTDTSEEVVEAARIWNQSANPTYHLRSPDRIARFFDGLELVEPGVVSPRWHPEPSESGLPAEIDSACGVARKP